MRSSMSAQSWDSVPPAPGWIVIIAPSESCSPESSESRVRSAIWVSTAASSVERSPVGHGLARLLERGDDPARLVGAVPEARLGHALLPGHDLAATGLDVK